MYTAGKLQSHAHVKYMCDLHSSYDHPHILAGQGTAGLEVVEQVPDLDAVVVPVGGGGLIAGVALAIKSLNPHVTVIVSPITSYVVTEMKFQDIHSTVVTL